MFETEVADGVLRVHRPATRWLATGWDGGYTTADAAFNVNVPEGFDRTDLSVYARERRHRAGYDQPGPTLLTGVGMQHARGARLGPVACVATAGVSNPAVLPMDPELEGSAPAGTSGGDDHHPGTVNLILGTTRALDDGPLATLLATAVEAKTATLTATTGFTGTTTDAVAVGCDPDGQPAPFAGSGTEIGAATRACVREAVTASLDARYADSPIPDSVSAAEYGTTTARVASVFDPGE